MATLQQIESVLLSDFQQMDRSDEMPPRQAAAMAAQHLWSMVPELRSSDAADTIKTMQSRIERKDQVLCELEMTVERKQMEIDRLNSMLLEHRADAGMQERAAEVAGDKAEEYEAEAVDWRNDGNSRSIAGAIAVRLRAVEKAIRALSLPSTDRGSLPHGLNDGCCSSIIPCDHQRRSPSTICETCAKAASLSPHDGKATP